MNELVEVALLLFVAFSWLVDFELVFEVFVIVGSIGVIDHFLDSLGGIDCLLESIDCWKWLLGVMENLLLGELIACCNCLNLKSEYSSSSKSESHLIEIENIKEWQQQGKLALWKLRCPSVGHYLHHEYWTRKAEAVVVVLGLQIWKSEGSTSNSEERGVSKSEYRWTLKVETFRLVLLIARCSWLLGVIDRFLDSLGEIDYLLDSVARWK